MASHNTTAEVPEPENLRKIFLGGLSRKTTDADLESHFKKFGTVKDCVVILNSNKESKGFGFVTMESIEETDLALKENNGGTHSINDKKVEVKRAIPRDSNIPSTLTNLIYVKNLGQTITEEHLTKYFATFSKVKSAKVIKERGTDKSRGFGFVEVDDCHAVDKISIMDKHEIEGRTVHCTKAEDRNNKQDWYKRQQGGRQDYGRTGNQGRSYSGYDNYGGGQYYGGGGGYGAYGGGGGAYGTPPRGNYDGGYGWYSPARGDYNGGGGGYQGGYQGGYSGSGGGRYRNY